MKAAVLHAPDAPLVLEDREVPSPGPGQVRIRLRASGVCGTDVHVWRGHFPIPLPAVIGHEPVGEIDALGAGVTHLQVGDRVGVSWTQGTCGRCWSCRRHDFEGCGDQSSWIDNGGGLAEQMIADAWGVTLLPDGLAWEDAAPMFCAGFTVMSGYRRAAPRPGERVGVLGLGGLGHLAVQIAKALGHEVVAITGSADKEAFARQLGADEVVVVDGHVGTALDAVGGVDVLLSTTNSMKQNGEATLGLSRNGRLVVMGVGAGPVSVEPMGLLLGHRAVRGASQGARADLVDVLELAAKGKVKPLLEVYRFDEVQTALERLAEGKVRFRAVVRF